MDSTKDWKFFWNNQEIIHAKCYPKTATVSWSEGVLNLSDTGGNADDRWLWCCSRCEEKAPEHIILQWKLLNG